MTDHEARIAPRSRLDRGSLRRATYLYACVLLHLATSCSSLRRVPGASLARAEGEWLGHVRVVLRDGTNMDLEQATIRRDSIVGLGGRTSVRLAVARSEVARVDTRSPVMATTFLLGMLAPVALAWLYAAMVQAGRN